MVGKGKKDKNGLRQGKWYYFNKSTKNLEYVYDYKDDVLDGEQKKVFSDGKTSFTGTSFAITANELLSFDPIYNVITLPKVSTSSYSKLKFSNSVGVS